MELQSLSGPPPLVLTQLSGLPGIDDVHYTDQYGNLWRRVRNRETFRGLSGLDQEEYCVDGLGNIFQKIGGAISQAARFVGQKVGQAGKAVGQGVAQAAKWTGQAVKTAVTTPYRLGMLAYMKMNFGGKAAMLRWAYIPYGQQLADLGIGPKAYAMIVISAKRLRDQFTNLGGSAATLKQAILTGKGNANREVPSDSDGLTGLGAALLAQDADWVALSQIHSIRQNLPPVAGLAGLSLSGLGALAADNSGGGVMGIITLVSSLVEKLIGLLSSVKSNDPADPVPPQYLPEEAVSEEDPVDNTADEVDGLGALRRQIPAFIAARRRRI